MSKITMWKVTHLVHYILLLATWTSGIFVSRLLENEVSITLSLKVLMELICLKLNRGEQREKWNLKRYLDVMQGLIIDNFSPQCTDIDEQESSIITNGQKGLIYMYQFQIPIHDWIHERENYLSKDVVVTKASCDISWQVVAHKLRC